MQAQINQDSNMTAQDFTLTLLFDKTPEEVFNAINNVTEWWATELEGATHNLGDEFTVTFFGDVHVSTQKLVELIPNKKVVWLVTKSALNFTDEQEWDNTTIVFEIEPQGDKTQLKFTHVGLLPTVQCYNACSSGWGQFINGSLYKLLTEGKGTPGEAALTAS